MSSNVRAVRATVHLTVAVLSVLTTVFVKTTVLASAWAGQKFHERKMK
ncbi:hypothetical protein [Paenirhodobacter populi]|nr:hypothetical protein [Sinirhodobacter populi]